MSSSVPSRWLEAMRRARRIVALTGAGMSAESGIPTFRDRMTGLWQRFDPQQLATPEAFASDPELVWAWYVWRRRLVAQAQPNAGHRALHALSALAGIGRVDIATQNVDDLHERAGSRSVIHLHGSLFASRCFDCERPYDGPDAPDLAQEPQRLAPPRCPACGGPIRPGVVWFGEALPTQAWNRALALVEQADVVLVIGTSGVVYPVAALPEAALQRGACVAVINPDADAAVPGALYWQTTAAAGLPKLVEALRHAN